MSNGTSRPATGSNPTNTVTLCNPAGLDDGLCSSLCAMQQAQAIKQPPHRLERMDVDGSPEAADSATGTGRSWTRPLPSIEDALAEMGMDEDGMLCGCRCSCGSCCCGSGSGSIAIPTDGLVVTVVLNINYLYE